MDDYDGDRLNTVQDEFDRLNTQLDKLEQECSQLKKEAKEQAILIKKYKWDVEQLTLERDKFKFLYEEQVLESIKP